MLREDGSNEIRVFGNQGPSGNPNLTLSVPDVAHTATAFPVVVTVRDSAGNVRTDFTGTVRFKSSLPGAMLPADYTFTGADAGSHTFMLSRAMAGTETLTVQLVSDESRFDLASFDVPADVISSSITEGGGLRNAGTATLDQVEISGFSALQGGGVFNSGSLTIDQCTITDCIAEYQGGGGLFNAATGVVEISHSTIDSNSAIPTIAGPVAIFHADGNALNSAGSGDGILQGSTTFGPGQLGQAFDFDASSGTRVEVPGLSGFSSQAFTVEAWVNADSVGSYNDFQGPVIITKDAPLVGPSFVILGPGNTNRFSFDIAFTDGTITYFQSSNTFSFVHWHHVALTWDGAWLRGYVNGNLEGEVLVGGSKQIVYDPDFPVTIGAAHCAGNPLF